MNAEILCVGTELLLGDILNTNAQFLSQELATLGISVYFQTVVGDNEERLLEAYNIAFSRADLVIASGGLGPTDDDLTKEVGAKFFNKKMILDEPSYDKIKSYFKSQNFQMTENNKKQAVFPENSTIIKNDKGTAPGCMIEENGKILIMLPGPPGELLPMFTNEVVPILKTKTNTKLISKVLRVCGIGESALEDQLTDLIRVQTNPTIATYAKSSEVHLRITASAKSDEEAKLIMQPLITEIYNRLGINIYGEDETTLEAAVIKAIMDNNYTLACCESCTGGLLTARLVDFPGVSSVLLEGVVSYSNESKMKRLLVNPKTIEEFGAVSAQTAAEMAEGIAKTSGANIGISTTGIAGPTGGTEGKPVGLVFVSIYINGNIITKQYNFKGDRERIRTRTVVNALDLLRRTIIDGTEKNNHS